MRLTVATLNVENLFSRARLLNLSSESAVTGRIAQVRALQDLLNQSSYSPTDKAQILTLLEDLNEFVSVREDREKLLARRGGRRTVVAGGRGDWDGAVVLKRARFDDVARENTAQVIKDTEADVVCIV